MVGRVQNLGQAWGSACSTSSGNTTQPFSRYLDMFLFHNISHYFTISLLLSWRIFSKGTKNDASTFSRSRWSHLDQEAAKDLREFSRQVLAGFVRTNAWGCFRNLNDSTCPQKVRRFRESPNLLFSSFHPHNCKSKSIEILHQICCSKIGQLKAGCTSNAWTVSKYLQTIAKSRALLRLVDNWVPSSSPKSFVFAETCWNDAETVQNGETQEMPGRRRGPEGLKEKNPFLGPWLTP